MKRIFTKGELLKALEKYSDDVNIYLKDKDVPSCWYVLTDDVRNSEDDDGLIIFIENE